MKLVIKESGNRLDKALANLTELSRSQANEEIKKGKVNVVYDFKEERDGYQAVITTDKKDSDEIVKFISLLKSNKIEF